MLQGVFGFYENGVITLNEYPDFDHRVPVIVTFLNGYTVTKINDEDASAIEESIESPAT
jgi:hypothetical protein